MAAAVMSHGIPAALPPAACQLSQSQCTCMTEKQQTQQQHNCHFCQSVNLSFLPGRLVQHWQLKQGWQQTLINAD
jgi:hypothetical protein